MPRRSRARLKSEHILLRVTASQRAELDGLAAALGLKIGDAIRMSMSVGLASLLKGKA